MANDADNGDDADAVSLGEFAATLARAQLAQLIPIVALSLDDAIELLRRTCPPQPLIEMLAAVSAELHKRHPPAPPKAVYGPHVGNA